MPEFRVIQRVGKCVSMEVQHVFFFMIPYAREPMQGALGIMAFCGSLTVDDGTRYAYVRDAIIFFQRARRELGSGQSSP